MAKREDYEQKTEKLLLPIIEKNQFELVDVEYVKEGSNWYLRAYIDKQGGITVDDCEIVSRALSDLLDKEDFIADAYILEVSSPGLGRPLKKDKDFERSLGEEVEIRLYKPRGKQKEFAGVLKGYDKETVTIETFIKEYNGIRLTVGYEVYDQENQRICCQGITKHCFLDREGKFLSLKQACLECHQMFVQGLEDHENHEEREDKS